MNISDSPDHNIHDYVLYCLIIFRYLPIYIFFVYLLIISIISCLFGNKNTCTLQASHVQVILYLRVLLFIFIYFTFSCMTCMTVIGHDCKK